MNNAWGLPRPSRFAWTAVAIGMTVLFTLAAIMAAKAPLTHNNDKPKTEVVVIAIAAAAGGAALLTLFMSRPSIV